LLLDWVVVPGGGCGRDVEVPGPPLLTLSHHRVSFWILDIAGREEGKLGIS
jgi:hypothetical protein